MQRIQKVFRMIAILPIKLYRAVISPLLPRSCIYTPSCSAYTIEAVNRHGILKGFFLGALRIGRCHSMFTGGEDPVPETFSIREGFRLYRSFRDTD